MANEVQFDRRTILTFAFGGPTAVTLAAGVFDEAVAAQGATRAPARTVRRIVTAHNAEGKSFIAVDDSVPMADIWRTQPEKPIGTVPGTRSCSSAAPPAKHGSSSPRFRRLAIRSRPAEPARISSNRRHRLLLHPQRRARVPGRHAGGPRPSRRSRRGAEHDALVAQRGDRAGDDGDHGRHSGRLTVGGLFPGGSCVDAPAPRIRLRSPDRAAMAAAAAGRPGP